jgi:hypothetical protein
MNLKTCAYDRVRPVMGLAMKIGVISDTVILLLDRNSLERKGTSSIVRFRILH